MQDASSMEDGSPVTFLYATQGLKFILRRPLQFVLNFMWLGGK